ncbi:molybdate ABC transporter substrate-binding protein [Colwellia sp. MEBiC06753]
MKLPSIVASLWLVLLTFPVLGEPLSVAVASNFYASAVKLADGFEQQTGHQIKIVTGSSGVLYAQIIKGAPFDVFLSADKQRPVLLFEQDRASKSRAYVLGKLALWLPNEPRVFGGSERHFNGNVLLKYQGKLAIANAKLAPYGKAAEQVLDALSLKDTFVDRIITGNNVNQTFHYVDSNNINAGFVPESLLILAAQKASNKIVNKYQKFWSVPEHLHQPIEQHVVVLKRSKQPILARQFVDFLLSMPTQKKLMNWGYLSPINKQPNLK